jgi:hypothetical protein
MTLGTNDKKKTAALAVLMLGAVYGVYSNLTDTSNSSAPPPAKHRPIGVPADVDPAAPMPAAGTSASQPAPPDIHRATPASAGRPRTEEFRPVLHPKRKEDQINPIDVDPTLRTDLLAKVQAVKLEGGQRNLFQFGVAQPVETEKPKLAGPEPKILLPGQHLMGPMPLVEKPKEVETAKIEPPPPPITYKYYGISTTRIDGKKTAFFLDGEDIILATEGMVVKKRYKVVRIGTTSVLMEDVDSKKQQTLNYTEEAQNASGG